MVRASVTHSAIASCATFLFFPHFDVICDLLLNKRTATRNLFVYKEKSYKVLLVLIENESSGSFPHFDKLVYCLYKMKQIHALRINAL